MPREGGAFFCSCANRSVTSAAKRCPTCSRAWLLTLRYVSHESEKPMRIIWELEHPLPPEFFREVKVAAG